MPVSAADRRSRRIRRDLLVDPLQCSVRDRYDTTAPSGKRQFVPSETASRRFDEPSET
jgi:hypothetical protein